MPSLRELVVRGSAGRTFILKGGYVYGVILELKLIAGRVCRGAYRHGEGGEWSKIALGLVKSRRAEE